MNILIFCVYLKTNINIYIIRWTQISSKFFLNTPKSLILYYSYLLYFNLILYTWFE